MKQVEINKEINISEHLASPSEAALSHLSELNGLRLSPHFKLGELTKTSHKTADGNIPSRVAIENLRNLCQNWLEDLGYRSPEVNRLAGGSATSNHLTGCAVDIRVTGFEQAIRYASILLDISDGTKRDLTSSRVCSRSAESMPASLCARSPADFDELFIERNKAGCYWIHFAVRPKDNRRKSGFLNV